MRTFLWICVLVNAGIGVATLADPLGFLAAVGLSTTGPNGEIELRAMYGGLELGLAAFLAWCAVEKQRAAVGVIAMTFMLLGLGGIRLLSWFLLQPDGNEHLGLILFELSGAAIGIFLIVKARVVPKIFA